MPELILAIDVGTTSTRAAVLEPGGALERRPTRWGLSGRSDGAQAFDSGANDLRPDGSIRSEFALAGLASRRLTSSHPAPGRVEQDARAVWRATRWAIGAALQRSGHAAPDIAAIGLTSQRASAVVWDRRTGEPAAPMVVWSDLRGAGRAGELAQAGFLLSPQQAATKLEAILAGIGAPRDRLAWGNIDSYILWRLTGGATHATDRSQAWPSGYLGFPDLGWNRALIDHQGLDGAMFPALADTWGAFGTTARAVLGAAIPVTAVIADQQSALIAHGEAEGVAKMTWGTSGTFNLATGTNFVFPSPSTPPLLVSSALGETRWCVEGMILSAGAALDWLRGAAGLGGVERFTALAGSVPDAAGAAFLPALQGLGAPHADPARRAVLAGLSGAVGQAHIARAGLEGLAFRAREVMDHVFSLTGAAPPPVLGVDGGLTASGVFLQVLADLTGRPVRRHATSEATLLGAALAAGRGAGLLSEADIAAARRFEAPIAPSIPREAADARFEAWKGLVHR